MSVASRGASSPLGFQKFRRSLARPVNAPQLEEVLWYLWKGDQLIVKSMDRLPGPFTGGPAYDRRRPGGSWGLGEVSAREADVFGEGGPDRQTDAGAYGQRRRV